MTKAYKLRPEYADTLVGGTVSVGPETRMINIVEALQDGGGEIVTSDHLEQAALENYYGEHGLVFDVFLVGEGGEQTPLDLHPELQTPRPTEPHASLPPAPSPGSSGPAPDLPNAEHGEGSEYQGLTVDELRQIATERGVNLKPRASKGDIVAALEELDAEGPPQQSAEQQGETAQETSTGQGDESNE